MSAASVPIAYSLVSAIACRLSVCPSVCDVGGSGPHKLEILQTRLIARTISPTLSLFVAQRPSTQSQRNIGKIGETRGGVGKSAVLEHKSGNISETRKCRGKVTMERFTRGSYIHRVHANKSPLKTWENRKRGRIQGLPKFLEYPLLSQEWVNRKATNFKFGRYSQRVHTNKSRLKIWEKLERGRIQELPNFFEYPLLSQERIKLRTSNLAGIFTRSIRTKAL